MRNLYIIILEGDNTTATTNINVKVDEELKKDADKLFCDLGLNMSTAITMFLKSAVKMTVFLLKLSVKSRMLKQFQLYKKF